ncbi:hypothetical protein DZF91_26830 [Actinomadura logoneensis]|uniref:Uncharacterized protein n=1 Tax=Actinomadura logoneensis TaxID=2293572 RepID=A0A372JF10_9ACTN|nr:hypothetical protein DZF91_26830 [Actinomadura logoneensis]
MHSTPAHSALGGDPNATRFDPSVLGGDPNATRFDASVPAAARFEAAGADETRLDRSPAETVADDLAAEAGDEAVRKASFQAALDDTLVWARQRWKMLTASAVAVFALVIGGITLYESFTDQTFGGVKGAGGTIGNVIRGQNEGTPHTPAHRPSQHPTDEPTAPGTTGPGDKVTDQPTGEPTGGPTGQPSESPSPDRSPTQRPTQTPTQEPSSAPTGGGGQSAPPATGKPGVQAPAPEGNQ